jgi:hypothetical protein
MGVQQIEHMAAALQRRIVLVERIVLQRVRVPAALAILSNRT